MNAQGEVRMAVVVRRMVDASAAGVIFTADPLTGQSERVVVNAIPGLGEALVGGRSSADHFVLSRAGAILERTLQGERAVVDEAKLGHLLRDALKAEAGLGYPLDLEWAIGKDGEVYWLQARPITTLELPGPEGRHPGRPDLAAHQLQRRGMDARGDATQAGPWSASYIRR
jgi:pyruvate,water dikinase